MSSPSNASVPKRTYAAAAASAADSHASAAATRSAAMDARADAVVPAMRPLSAAEPAPLSPLPQIEELLDRSAAESAATAPSYQPPHTRNDDEELPARVTKTFAQMATRHANTGRNAVHNPVVDAAAVRMSSAAPTFLEGPSTPHTAPTTVVVGSSRRVSNTQSPPAIGNERQSGSLTLSDVPQRKVLAATLRVVRSYLVKKTMQEPALVRVLDFLDRIFPRGGQAETTYDAILGSIEVAYRYPVSEENWKVWEQILDHCPLAKEVDQALAVGAGEFDQVNGTFLHSAHLMNSGDAPENLLVQLVTHYNLDKKHDILFNCGGGPDRNKEP